ncbi:MAG: hypothetical protein RRZ24_10620 [Clostridia bacterium]
MPELFAGVASVDISPKKGHDLGGYPHFPRPNTGIHDPLIASCIYLKADDVQVALVTLDLLFFSKRNVSIVRTAVEKVCSIPGANIFISCSHTHSGPWASGKLDEESLVNDSQSEDSSYVESLNANLIDLICQAKRHLFAARLGYGMKQCGAEKGIGGNRRDRNGISDPSVNVIAIQDNDFNIRGIYANYALHPTFIHEDSDVVTADYPGYIRATLNDSFPTAVFGFTQGTSGNQSSRYFRQGQSFEEAARVGGELGHSVISVINQMKFTDNVLIRTSSQTIPLYLRAMPGIEEAANRRNEDRNIYEKLIAEKASYLAIQNANVKMLGSEDLFGYALLQSKNLPIDLVVNERDPEIMAIALNDLLLIGLPGEVFVEFGLEIKQKSNFDLTIVAELANGCMPGYVCTKKAIAEGGYEVDTSMVHPDMGEMFVHAALQNAQNLKLDCAK